MNYKVSIWKTFEQDPGILREGVSFSKMADGYASFRIVIYYQQEVMNQTFTKEPVKPIQWVKI